MDFILIHKGGDKPITEIWFGDGHSIKIYFDFDKK